MSNTGKSCISGWWLSAILALFLWYRNANYDRILAGYIFLNGLIQLIEYGIYSGADPKQSGQSLFIILWMQCLILGIGVFLFFKQIDKSVATQGQQILSSIAEANLILFSILFIGALIVSIFYNWDLRGTYNDNGYIEWTSSSDTLLGNWNLMYLLGIFLPFLLLLAYYSWASISITILLLYLLLTGIYVTINYPTNTLLSTWSYYMIGFAFLVWFLGLGETYSTGKIL